MGDERPATPHFFSFDELLDIEADDAWNDFGMLPSSPLQMDFPCENPHLDAATTSVASPSSTGADATGVSLSMSLEQTSTPIISNASFLDADARDDDDDEEEKVAVVVDAKPSPPATPGDYFLDTSGRLVRYEANTIVMARVPSALWPRPRSVPPVAADELAQKHGPNAMMSLLKKKTTRRK